MDGAFYVDTRAPFDIATTPPAQVTLASTDKALYTASEVPGNGAGYWGVGKKVRIWLFGKMTTGTSPGNGTFDIYWGTGADANGTIIQSSGTLALAASQTNIPWWLDVVVECTTRGSNGKLFAMGFANMNGLASTNVAWPIPASAPATSSAIDLTAASIISVQFKRSGTTAETMQVLQMLYQPLN